MDMVGLIIALLLLIAIQRRWLLPSPLGGKRSEGEQLPEIQHEGPVEPARDALTRLAQSLARDEGANTKSAHAIRFYRAYALESLGRLEKAIVAYEQCQRDSLAGPATRYAALASFRQGLLLSRLSRWAEAEPCLQRSIALSRAVPLPAIQLSAAGLLVRLYRSTGRRAEALDAIDKVLEIARLIGDEPTQAHALDAAGDLNKALAQPQRALRSYEQSFDLFRKLGNAEGTLVAKLDIGALYQAQGEWDEAAAWYRACLRDAEESERIVDQAAILYELGCLHIHKDQPRIAAHLLLRDMALYRQMGHAQGTDRAGRTLMGLGVWMHRRLTADRLTFRDIERGSAGTNNGDEEDKE